MLSFYKSNGQSYAVCYKIRSIPNFTEIYEYGIFLRLSEIYMDRSAALPDVEKSVSFYKGRTDCLKQNPELHILFC